MLPNKRELIKRIEIIEGGLRKLETILSNPKALRDDFKNEIEVNRERLDYIKSIIDRDLPETYNK